MKSDPDYESTGEVYDRQMEEYYRQHPGLYEKQVKDATIDYIEGTIRDITKNLSIKANQQYQSVKDDTYRMAANESARDLLSTIEAKLIDTLKSSDLNYDELKVIRGFMSKVKDSIKL